LSIGLLGPRPIGQVRLEREADGDVEVSIAIAPEARGEGLARPLLRAAMAAAQRSPALGGGRYVARVRPENAASIALFERAGFQRVAPDADADGLVFALPVGAPLEDADRQPVEAGVLVQESGPA
jgi:RimJ/RimL family protein N-acetyltransferase